MTTPESRAATAAAVGALTEVLLADQAGEPLALRDYLQQLMDDDGVGALAQGYFGLLNLAGILLPLAAEHEGLAPQELLARIGLSVARGDG